jgi:hypothetical protein
MRASKELKMNNKFIIGVYFLLAFTVLQANAGTYCGILGDKKLS